MTRKKDVEMVKDAFWSAIRFHPLLRQRLSPANSPPWCWITRVRKIQKALNKFHTKHPYDKKDKIRNIVELECWIKSNSFFLIQIAQVNPIDLHPVVYTEFRRWGGGTRSNGGGYFFTLEKSKIRFFQTRKVSKIF